jgi:prepilin-type N-terminal cleavage/methylation domain-containing protein
MSKSIKAFTLIELLVVIAIIGILSGFLFVSLTGAISAANDAKRKADLAEIQKAILIYSINSNVFPSGDTYPCTIGGGTQRCTSLESNLASYLTTIPKDPSGSFYTYNYSSGNYTLSSSLSNNSSYYYESSDNSWVNGFLANGACGAAATTYASGATDFSGALCSAGSGVTIPASPVFPTAGSATTWTCGGAYGGSSSDTCTASRNVDPIINGAFDGTSTGWTMSGGDTKSVSDTSAHAGSYTSYIDYTFDCAKGEIYQNIVVPNVSGIINLNFFERTSLNAWSGNRGVEVNNDWVWSVNNYSSGRASTTTNWLEHTIDISSYKGQTVKIGVFIDETGLIGCGNSDHSGWIRVDDIKLVNVP